jgi:hypothetical protein
MKNSITNFTLGDPVTVHRNGMPVSGHIWGHTFASLHDPDWYDVITSNAILTRLRAGDIKHDTTGNRIEATR